MIPVGRRIKRLVPRERRSLVFELQLLDGESVVTVREHGRRRGFSITVPRLYVLLAERAANDRRARKRGRHRGLATERKGRAGR